MQASLVSVGASRVCVVEVTLHQKRVFFLSGYVQPVTGAGCSEIGRALRAVGRNSCKCLGMDGNGHSPVWGPATESPNPQGILLENLLASEDLVCVSSPESPPTYTGDNNICSWIDVTAASMDLIEHIWKWQVVDDAHLGSDHALITWELGVKEHTPIVRKMYNWQQLDWTRFRHRLKSAMIPFSEPLLSTPSQLDSVISRFTTMMQKLVREHVPIKTICHFSREWWTPEIKQLRSLMRRAVRKWQKHRLLCYRTEYLQFRRDLRSAIRRSKQFRWRLWCASFTRANPWQLLRKVKGRMPSTVEDLRQGDNFIQTDEDKAHTLAINFFPKLPAANHRMHQTIDSAWDTARPPGTLGFGTITIAEIRTACTRMRTTAAVGPDELSILIVKRCFRELKTFLQLVFNASLRLGFFPSQWKEAKVLALRKPRKERYDTPRAYRPISLLNHFGKLLELVVNTRLKKWLESHNAVSPYQAGFRPGKHA